MEEQVREVRLMFTRRYRLTERECPVCGTRFVGTTRRVYCGPPCARKAAWARRGAEWNANRNAKRRAAKAEVSGDA